MSIINITNPYSGEVVFEQECDTWTQVQSWIKEANHASSLWKRRRPQERAQLLLDALGYFQANKEEIARDITTEMGKPITAAREEIDYMIERAEWMCRFVQDGALDFYSLKRYDTGDFEGRIEFTAKGLVYIIAPWNYPLFCAINGVISALLSGSSVILKHTSTPSVGRHFQRAFGTLGGLPHLLQDIIVDFDVSAQLVELGDIDHVIFTGSVNGGRTIQSSVGKRASNDLAKPFINTSLELGSNDAAYVAEDADLEHALLL